MGKEKKTRQLTKKEQARMNELAKKEKKLKEDGFMREDVTISIQLANVMALILSLPFIVPIGIWFFMRNGLHFSLEATDFLLLAVLFIVCTVIHEVIHGFTWGLFAANRFRSIEFGFMAEYLTPYCTCSEPLQKGAYILGSIMPFLILGIIPAITAVFLNSYVWLLVGFVMIMGAGGDLTIIGKMLGYRTEGNEVIFLDHPSECGFIVFKRI